MNRKKSKPSSIGEKINDLLTPKQLRDPEQNSDDETIAKNRYFDSDEEEEYSQPTGELSDIRKKNVRLLQDVDSKYSGKVSSRNELDMSSEYEESSDSEDDAGDFSMKLNGLDSDDDDDGEEKVDSDDENDVSESEKRASNGGEDSDEADEAFDDQVKELNEDEESNESEAEDDEDEEEDGSAFDEDESDFDGGDIMLAGKDENDESDEAKDEAAETEKDDEKQLQINKDVEKGVSIQNQLHIWEKLLEMRIHSQKVLLKANSLPPSDYFDRLNSNAELNEAVQKTSSNVENLLTKLCTLQKSLINQFPEMKEVSAKRRRTDADIDDTDRLSKVAKKLGRDFADFKEYRNATISKWYDRTKVLTPGASKGSKQPTFDIIRNIEGVLSNRDELVKKSQLYKGGYEIIGVDATQKEKSTEMDADAEPITCSEIYDDTDFYHSQLRELIEFKTNTSTSPADMTKQFAELQKLRNKIKKVVDTRASKGRKIRYAVHNKMVNFMARNDPSEWTDEAKTELFSSLFGSRTG